MSADQIQRFFVEQTDVRGSLVRLERSYTDIVSAHGYPGAISHVLGEFLAAGLLLGDTIKYDGRLVLQARGEGAVKLLMAEATHDRQIRGIARIEAGVTVLPVPLDRLLPGGTLAVTIEPAQGERYQSLVPLDGGTLAACLEHYFDQSEQLGTLLRIAADDRGVSGFLLQQLPPQKVTDRAERRRQWEHLSILGGSIENQELLSLDFRTILRRLYHEENVMLQTPQPVTFNCSCSELRMAQALLSLGSEELASLFDETPEISIDCEFCRTHYQFDQHHLTQLLTADEPLH